MNIVITGSTRGIGLGLAKAFLNNGHNVLINGRDRMFCGELYRELHNHYPRNLIHIYACDVTCYNSVDRMFWEAERFFGKVDIWINNAGMNQEHETIENQTNTNISQVIDLNLKATIYGTQVAIKNMKDRGGFIYNMEGYGSNNMMTEKMPVYGATKRAVTYFTQSVSKEYKDSKVKIGLLSPGIVITDLLKKSLPENSQERDRQIKMYNILADKPDIVTSFLVNKILSNKKNGVSIKWLTTPKVLKRFITCTFVKRNLFV
ncbi:MAG: SDR family oxidoreductase [Spirochaetales bacterium]|nr:SDR family oxidoreductase [Spirochaetales bacterium]